MNFDWHTIALVIAAVIGIVLKSLNLLSTESLISLTLLIVAVFALHSSIEGSKSSEEHEKLLRITNDISQIKSLMRFQDLKLIPPNQLISFTSEFTDRNRGELWWYNICVDMLRSQKLFNIMIGDALADPKTIQIRIVLRSSEKILWDKYVKPKLENCNGKEKLKEPTIKDSLGNISFGLISNNDDSKEGLMSVWGEPFMMQRSDQNRGTVLPRYLISIDRKSELILRLVEIFREKTLIHISNE